MGKVGVSETELARSSAQAWEWSCSWGTLGRSDLGNGRLKRCERQAARIKRGDAKACPLRSTPSTRTVGGTEFALAQGRPAERQRNQDLGDKSSSSSSTMAAAKTSGSAREAQPKAR
jgi:hypothetical protein